MEREEKYEVRGLAVVGPDGATLYDLLDSAQMAHDICTVLNAGIGPEWDAVSAALDRLVVVKELPQED
jgi:hypothetical protein